MLGSGGRITSAKITATVRLRWSGERDQRDARSDEAWYAPAATSCVARLMLGCGRLKSGTQLGRCRSEAVIIPARYRTSSLPVVLIIRCTANAMYTSSTD